MLGGDLVIFAAVPVVILVAAAWVSWRSWRLRPELESWLRQRGFQPQQMERRWFTRGPFPDISPAGTKTGGPLLHVRMLDRGGSPVSGWVSLPPTWPWRSSERWRLHVDPALDSKPGGISTGPYVSLMGLATLALVAVGAVVMLAVHPHRSAANAPFEPLVPPLEPQLVSTTGRILFIAQNDGTDDFYVVNVDGSGLTRLTHLPRGIIHSSPPIVSPDRTRMALSVGGVYVIRLDRLGETSRLDRPGGWLAWSPDGSQLASLSIDDQKRLHLYVFSADGSGEPIDLARKWPSTAVGDQQFAGHLAWSPDARRFAFVLVTRPRYRAAGPSHSHLYIALPDGSGLRNLSLDPKALPVAGDLAWSPDGRRLVLQGGRGIATVDVDLKWTDIPVWPNESRSEQWPAWSPDGTRLAWFNPDSIVVSDPDGLHQQELTKGRCRGVHPSWSADGLRIAFICRDSYDRSNVFVMNADGTGLTHVTNFGDDISLLSPASAYVNPKYPVWLPSSSATAATLPQ